MEHSWMLWLLIPAFFMFAGGRSCYPSGRRRHRSSSRSSEEVARLKAELAASQDQINALKSRLEAVETIVTDEEAELRWEFHKLQKG
ncbi:MAG: hypothetical protein GYB42_09170 [Alphaproteobacteria bacterium]|nr:hypothetical protein [Alphaproteobacteria bacterium]